MRWEKEVTDSGMTEHKHYLSAGGMVFAMQITRSGNLTQGGSTKPQESLQYLHHDHLGSVAVVTDHTGSVVERLAYDPWGKRRFPNGTADVNDTIVGLTIDRGFTMHEHLDEMGLIHMNGRIFDPLIGRFMSADPFIQAPENLQSHNRFAYVMNNPLSYTDPSGYFSLRKLFRAVLAIAVGYFTGQWIGNLFQSAAIGANAATAFATVAPAASGGAALTGLGSAIAGAAGGFAAGLVGSGGDLKAGLLGALSGGAFGFVGGTYAAGSVGNYVGHAVTGCITSVAGGGQCGSGAASALFGKFATNMTQGIQSDLGRGIAAVVAGGVGSVIGGGKFENGAVTAAYGYLFNELMSRGGVDSRERMRQGGYGMVADEGRGGVTWKQNYPDTIPATGHANDALQCTAKCTGADLFATGGQEQTGHSKTSHHYRNEAVDFRALTVADSKVLACAANCGFKAGAWESAIPGKRFPHWHFQLNKGNRVPELK